MKRNRFWRDSVRKSSAEIPERQTERDQKRFRRGFLRYVRGGVQERRLYREVPDQGYEEIAGSLSRFWREGTAEIPKEGT